MKRILDSLAYIMNYTHTVTQLYARNGVYIFDEYDSVSIYTEYYNYEHAIHFYNTYNASNIARTDLLEIRIKISKVVLLRFEKACVDYFRGN